LLNTLQLFQIISFSWRVRLQHTNVKIFTVLMASFKLRRFSLADMTQFNVVHVISLLKNVTATIFLNCSI